MHRLHELVVLAPFLEVNRCSAVGVDSPDDGEEVELVGELAVLAEEGAQVHSVNRATIVLVDRSEGRQRRVIVLHLQLTLQDLDTASKVNFFFHDRSHRELDIPWQAVEPADPSARSVQGHISQDVVLARKEHLDELLVREPVGAITIEELKQLERLTLGDVIAGVVPEEVNDLVARDVGRAVAVDSLEG